MYVFSCKNKFFVLFFFFIFFFFFLLESESSEIYTHYVWKIGQIFFWKNNVQK